MRYSLAFFDLGGVVVDVESDRLVLQVSQMLGRSFEDVQEAVYHRDLLLPFELGQITPQAYFQGLQQQLKLPWNYEQFLGAWNGIFSENRDVIMLMGRLAKSCRLVALTNTNELHLRHIQTTMPALSVFSDWIASCGLGCRKPELEMYQRALERAGVAVEQAIYVDDRPEMIEGGRRAGLTAIRFESSSQLEQDLRAIGVPL